MECTGVKRSRVCDVVCTCVHGRGVYKCSVYTSEDESGVHESGAQEKLCAHELMAAGIVDCVQIMCNCYCICWATVHVSYEM